MGDSPPAVNLNDKYGQSYRCPACALLFPCSKFLDHIKDEHPGVQQPKRKDKGIIVDVGADFTVREWDETDRRRDTGRTAVNSNR